MDFKEYLIKRKKGAKEIVFTVLLYLAALVIAFVFLAIIPPIGGLNLLVIVGGFYGAHKLSAKFNREYEYVVTKDNVDIDVIFNKTSRKRVVSFSVRDVEYISTAESITKADIKRYNKVINASSNKKDAEVYVACLEKNGGTLIMFEPTYAMLEILRKYEPRKVTVK